MTDQPDKNLQPLPSLPCVTGSTSSMPSLPKPTAAKMDTAGRVAKKILSAYPDYGKAPPEYIFNFAEALSYLTEAELAIVTSPRDGVASRCQFLPTIADIHALLREHREKAEQFKPAATAYHRLKPEAGPWDQETDFERKQRVVREYLGYNPGDRDKPAKREFTPPTDADMANLRLKTPPGPITPQLRALLKQQGWPFIPAEDAAAARGNKA
jgi:hypothetical protein